MLRNEALLLCPALLAGNADLQKIVAFSGAFEKLFDIINQEGGSDGGIVVQDAMTVVGGLLRFNVSNQVSSMLPMMKLDSPLELFPRIGSDTRHPANPRIPLATSCRCSLARRICAAILAGTEDLQCRSSTWFDPDADRWTRWRESICNGSKRSHAMFDRNCPRIKCPEWSQVTSSQYTDPHPFLISTKSDITFNRKSIAPDRGSRRRGTPKWRICPYTSTTRYRRSRLHYRRRRFGIRWSRSKR